VTARQLEKSRVLSVPHVNTVDSAPSRRHLLRQFGTGTTGVSKDTEPFPQDIPTRSAVSSAVNGPGHDLGRVRIRPNIEQTQPAPTNEGRFIVNQSAGGASPGVSPSSSPPSLRSPLIPPRVDRIDIISSSAGAIGGYTAITSGDLNSPGPFNNPATGGVSNVHQIHFHLDQGDSVDLSPRRELQRSSWRAGVENQNPPDRPAPGGVGQPTPGGFSGVVVGPDGPPAHEVQRPSPDKIVIADAPGGISVTSAQFPYIYRSHFRVTVADSDGQDIAHIRYDVRIEKRSATDIPNTENSIVAVAKEDTARSRSLR
jgi:hypothetical protein